jgi:hypothetical protein
MVISHNGVAEGEIDGHLYSYDYSLCSLMTRYMIVVRGLPQPGTRDIKIGNVEVDIHHAFDQLSEWFLCDVNSKGQVCQQKYRHIY